MATLSDIILADGADNSPGISINIAFALVDDLIEVPTPVLGDTLGMGTVSDLVTITTDAVTKAGKQFYKMRGVVETGKVETNLVGEKKSKSFEDMVEMFIPGNSPEVLGAITRVRNANLIVWVQDRDGEIRQIGTAGFPAQLNSSTGGSGDARVSQKGFTVTFESVDRIPAPHFQGDFNETPSGGGSVVARTDLFT